MNVNVVFHSMYKPGGKMSFQRGARSFSAKPWCGSKTYSILPLDYLLPVQAEACQCLAKRRDVPDLHVPAFNAYGELAAIRADGQG